MPRLFIIGAGFSKAIADAPLAGNMLKAIWQKSLTETKYIWKLDWPSDRDAFIKILHYFHSSVQLLIERLENQPDHEVLNKNFEDFLESLNVEFVCSYLDLLTKHCFIPKVEGIDMQGCPIPYIQNFHKEELKNILGFINHGMLELLLPESLRIKEEEFYKMADFFTEEDNFISFNYDLLIEQMLWKRKLWNPFDGYGIEFNRTGNKNIPDSKTKVIKIHGSINWRTPEVIFHPNLELIIDHPFKDEPLFEGIKIPKTVHDKKKYPTYPLSSYIVAPTFIKAPKYHWEIKLLNRAIKFCREATEIYILGYSAPDADYITNLLFSVFNKTATVYIVLWDCTLKIAEDLGNKLVDKYGFDRNRVIHEDIKIENWIDNNFKFLAYQDWKENYDYVNLTIKKLNEKSGN